MRRLQTCFFLALALAALDAAPAAAGMPSVNLTDAASLRLQSISFFLVVFLVSAVAVRGIWNGFRTDTGNIVLVGEVNAGFRAWGDPLNVRDPRAGTGGGPHAYGTAGKRPPQFLMLDGSVRSFDPKELAELTGKPPE